MTHRRLMTMIVAMTCLGAVPAATQEPVAPLVVELMSFVASGDDAPTLEGELHIPLRATAETTVPGVVLCHPHPLYGGTMTNAIVIRLRDRLLEMGIATLAFNFRGVGASEGEYGEGVAETNDVIGAMAYLRARPEVQADRCGIVGYSFGAVMALKAAAVLGDVTACGLVGFATEVDEDGLGEVAHLSQVKCPLIFVSGTEDIYSKPDGLSQLVADHNLTAQVVPLEGVDHFFADAHWRGVMSQSIADFMAARLLGEI